MGRRRGNNNLESIIYFFVIILAIGIIGTIIEYIIPILITCGIAGAIIGTVAILKHYKIIKSKEPKEPNTPNTLEEYEIKYTFADDLVGLNNNYRKKSLLTDHEYNFYCALVPIAKKYGFCILSKIRIADLVEPTAHVYRERSEYFHYFGKIKAKHIDFALCDPSTLQIKLLIELDDWTHNTVKGKERDEFVEQVYEDAGYRLLRVYDNWNLDKKIRDALSILEE